MFGNTTSLKYLLLGTALFMLSACGAGNKKEDAQVTIKTENITYTAGGAELSGFMAYPSGKKNLPAVLVVHEWWGHNDYARNRAKMLAEEGYVAFALDMYGDGKLAQHPKDANAFMMEVINTEGLAKERFQAAYDLVKQSPLTDDEKIAAIGYCFGGAVVLSMARMGMDLDGVVSFHGSLGALPPVAEDVDAKFLVLNGADDPFVKEEQIEQFKSDMDAADVDYQFINYPGAVHAFTNPGATEKGQAYGLPLKYDPEADKASWSEMKSFFKELF